MGCVLTSNRAMKFFVVKKNLLDDYEERLKRLDILGKIFKTFRIVSSAQDFVLIQVLNPFVGLVWTLGARTKNTKTL